MIQKRISDLNFNSKGLNCALHYQSTQTTPLIFYDRALEECQKHITSVNNIKESRPHIMIFSDKPDIAKNILEPIVKRFTSIFDYTFISKKSLLALVDLMGMFIL